MNEDSPSLCKRGGAILLLIAGLCCPHSGALAGELESELAALTSERRMLTHELEQYQKTVAVLQASAPRTGGSTHPASKKLTLEIIDIKQRLITITQDEVELLQRQIVAQAEEQVAEPAGTGEAPAAGSTPIPENPVAREQVQVERLLALISQHNAELQVALATLPSDEELEHRSKAAEDARLLAKIPFSSDKVRLSGAEGSTALTRISERLTDPAIPESRRDIAPICSIRTHLFGSLIASENRSLVPVGKNNYIARVRLQPGVTRLLVRDASWEFALPADYSAQDHLITLYTPPAGTAELHVFAVADLLAQDKPHIPPWLPAEIQLGANAE